LIFLADTISGGQSASTVAKRPGWSKIAAVQDHEVIGLNDDIASRWGPRLSVLMNQLTAAVKGALKNPKLWK
jgi:iron complex transport system substrate-binding protein